MKEIPESKKRKLIHESFGHVPKSLSHSNTYSWGRKSSLYLRVIGLDGKPRWDYFSLNKENIRGNEGHVLTLLNEVDDRASRKFVVLDSLIYCIAGTREYIEWSDEDCGPRGNRDWSRCVLVLDTKCKGSELYWRNAPDMISPRYGCTVVSLHGKIYVMGGVDRSCHPAWGEYLSPGLKYWRSLPDPPQKDLLIFGFFISAFRERRKIVVGSPFDHSIYLYDVRGHSWEKLDVEENDVPMAHRPPPIVAGNILYWFNDQKLYAYDLEKKKFASGFIEGVKLKYFQLSGRYYLGPMLIYLGGGKLCLITHQVFGTKKDTSTVRFYLFGAPEITSQDDRESLRAHVLDSYKYNIKISDGIIDALLMGERVQIYNNYELFFLRKLEAITINDLERTLFDDKHSECLARVLNVKQPLKITNCGSDAPQFLVHGRTHVSKYREQGH